MTDLNLTELRAKAEAATHGPWHVYDRNIGSEIHAQHDPGEVTEGQCGDCWPVNIQAKDLFTKADAEFIATARNHWAALIERVQAAEARCVELAALHTSEQLARHDAEAAVERVRAFLAEPVVSDWAKRYWSGRHDSHRPMMAVTLEDYRDRTLAALDGDA